MTFFLLVVVWLVWCFVASLGLRYALKRWVFRYEREWLAYLCCYATMIVLGLLAAWFVDYSGWHFKHGNTQPIQRVAEFVLILSPSGLPLHIGGPVVILYDLIQAWRRSESYI